MTAPNLCSKNGQVSFSVSANDSVSNSDFHRLTASEGKRQLVFASFFFWKPGTIMQKSLTGLIRSLLHDVLKECPDLIREILPDYWGQIKSTPWQIQSKLPLSDKEIREAFSRLISDPNLYTNHCFCFFIDGLDEYEGTYQEDPKTLVDLLNSWTRRAPTAIKICVSSRGYNVFMNAFAENQRICLHNLTRSDMTQYVLNKLRHMDPEEDRMTLAKAMVENAQGIFVWITLVVKRIREQIENGANIDTLKREIDSLPRELNDLFEHIVNSLLESDFKLASQTFTMVMELNPDIKLSLFSYSFLDEFTQDPLFALREDFQRQSLTPQATAQRIEYARKRLIGCCKGLLETSKDVPSNSLEDYIIITHRSISEFLSFPTQKDRIERSLDGFNTIDAISQLTLAELWLRAPGHIRNGSFESLALGLLPFRSQAKLDVAPYTFLNSLALAWQRHQDQGKYDCVGDKLWVLFEHRNRHCILAAIISHPGVAPSKDKSQESRHLRHPIYSAAVSGNYDYVLWELRRGKESAPLFSPHPLVYCLLVQAMPIRFMNHEMNHEMNDEMNDKKRRFIEGLESEQSVYDMIECLHTHHGIHPDTPSSLFYTGLYPATPQGKSTSGSSGYGDEKTVVPLWHHLLLRCYRKENDKRLSYFVEKFLEYGADPYFYISVSNCPNLRMRLVVRVRGEIQEQWLVDSPKDQDLEQVTEDKQGQAAYECENMSLADLVERWGFENRTRVLELIKKNILMLGGEKQDNVMWIREVVDPDEEEDTSTTLAEADSGTQEAAKLSSDSSQALSDDEKCIDSGSRKGGLTERWKFGSQKLLTLSVAISVGVLVLGEYFILFERLPVSLADYA